MRHRKVVDLMTTDVVTVTPDTPFKDLARLMDERHVGALPVVDGDRLVGVVTESDLLCKEEYQDDGDDGLFERLTHRRSRAKAVGSVAREVMSSPAVSVTGEATMVEAARLIARRGVKHLPVTDGIGHVVGIVSRGDLLRVFLRPDEEIRAEVVEALRENSAWTDPAGIVVTVAAGVVTLSGRVERSSMADVAANLVRAVDGVVGVHNEVTFRFDDRVTVTTYGPIL